MHVFYFEHYIFLGVIATWPRMAGALPIDPEEWDLVIDKLVRLHDNIQLEIVELVAKIKQEMNGTGSSMVPLAEDKSNFGKVSY